MKGGFQGWVEVRRRGFFKSFLGFLLIMKIVMIAILCNNRERLLRPAIKIISG